MPALGQANILQKPQLKAKLPQIQPGDTVRVHQLIREGGKTRTQIFEGLAVRLRNPNDGNAYLTVRKIASGVGVEKGWFLHSPNVEKIEVVRRSKVRRAFLSYMRERQGKSARLTELGFDKESANVADHRSVNEIAEQEAETKANEAKANEAKSKEVKAVDESQVVEESTEDLANEENAAASQEDAADDGDNEQDLAEAETESGLDKADAQDDKNQNK